MEKDLFDAVNMLILTNRMHKKLIDSKVSDFIGLHRTQHIILMHLADREKLPSQKELAEHLNITPAAVTGALKKLEAGGYIERKIGSDNRYNEITITPIGLSVVEKTHEIFFNTDESIFKGFSAEDIERLTVYLKKMQINIEKQMKGED